MRYFIEFSYNGKKYFGWQIQPHQITVQEVFEYKLSTLLRKEIKITGAGRTDSGVHAKKMFAHFEFDEQFPENFIHRLNAFLPNDIVAHQLFSVKPDAHARFDALRRTYHYHIQLGKNPFNFDATWQLLREPDLEKMNEAAEWLLGQQEFSSFAKVHTDVKTHICEVYHAKWEEAGNELRFEITADRFLRDMVRAIVGTLVDVGLDKISLAEFREIIDKKDRKFASGSAPAQGLYLVDVIYPKSIFSE